MSLPLKLSLVLLLFPPAGGAGTDGGGGGGTQCERPGESEAPRATRPPPPCAAAGTIVWVAPRLAAATRRVLAAGEGPPAEAEAAEAARVAATEAGAPRVERRLP